MVGALDANDPRTLQNACMQGDHGRCQTRMFWVCKAGAGMGWATLQTNQTCRDWTYMRTYRGRCQIARMSRLLSAVLYCLDSAHSGTVICRALAPAHDHGAKLLNSLERIRSLLRKAALHGNVMRAELVGVGLNSRQSKMIAGLVALQMQCV